MSTQTRPPELHKSPIEQSSADSRRPAWRQRLVEAERGITHGFRGDSTFFVHFFVGSIIVATAFVLGISPAQWAVLMLALTLVLSAEMFNQVLKTLLNGLADSPSEAVSKALRIGTAAVFVTMAGAALSIGLIFGHRIFQMFAG